MTQESISDFVHGHSEKLAAIFGNTLTPHVYPQGISVNTETGEVYTHPPRKGRYKTPSESFVDLFSIVLQGRYQFEVEAPINAGANKDLLLIDLQEKWIAHQRAADSLLQKIPELKYIIEYNPDNWITTEGCKDDLRELQYDQIREQMFADFYKLVISNLTTKETPKRGLSTAQFLLIEYFSTGNIFKKRYEDQRKVYERLVAKYGKTEEDYKKALNRVSPIIDNKITERQKRPLEKDLWAIIEYFDQQEQPATIKQIKDFAKERDIYFS